MSQTRVKTLEQAPGEVREYSYDVAEELFQKLEEEFGARKVVEKFAQAIRGKSPEEADKIAGRFFGEYGRRWMERTLELGEEYPDRTYQVARAAAERTGLYDFGVIPQRFLEIAYLAIQEFTTLPILECTADALRYKVPECTVYREIREQCGEEAASRMYCRHACLAGLKALHEGLGQKAEVKMLGTMAEDGACHFKASRVEEG